MAKKTRSPNFPSLSLKSLLPYTQAIWNMAQRHWVPVNDVIVECWELAPSSSGSQQIVGALRAFGLAETQGKGITRQIKISETGAKIVTEHPDREKLLRRVALCPKVHSDIWEHLGENGLPPDATIRSYLLHDYEPPFNQASVDRFINQFRDTITFTGLDSSGTMYESDSDGQEGIEAEQEPNGSGATNQGSASGGISTGGTLPAMRPGMKQDVYGLDEGDLVLQWPSRLSRASYEEAVDWLDLIKRKLSRAVLDEAAQSPTSTEGNNDDG